MSVVMLQLYLPFLLDVAGLRVAKHYASLIKDEICCVS